LTFKALEIINPCSTILNKSKLLIIADELSHLCGILSQSMRKNEPPFADWRASTINRITSCIIKIACKQHDNIIQEVFLWLIAVKFWSCILMGSVKEQSVLALATSLTSTVYKSF